MAKTKKLVKRRGKKMTITEPAKRHQPINCERPARDTLGPIAKRPAHVTKHMNIMNIIDELEKTSLLFEEFIQTLTYRELPKEVAAEDLDSSFQTFMDSTPRRLISLNDRLGSILEALKHVILEP